jgi:hypothetical protein
MTTDSTRSTGSDCQVDIEWSLLVVTISGISWKSCKCHCVGPVALAAARKRFESYKFVLFFVKNSSANYRITLLLNTAQEHCLGISDDELSKQITSDVESICLVIKNCSDLHGLKKELLIALKIHDDPEWPIVIRALAVASLMVE